MNPNQPKPWLVLMMKAPRAGAVKTRLGAEIGMERAAAIHRAFVERLVRSPLSAPARAWTPVIAFDPPDGANGIQDWLRPIAAKDTVWVPQSPGDLGARLEAVFGAGFAADAPAVAAIGADCLDISADEIAAAFAALRRAPIVMGPAEDGGYWLIALGKPHYEIFRGMPWSQPTLADATRALAASRGWPIAELATKFDVDTRADLLRLDAGLRHSIGIDDMQLAPNHDENRPA